MKDFKDFLKTLSEDELASIAESATEPLKAIQDNDHSETRLGNSVGVISLSISLALLERYHKWLHE